MFIYVRRLFLYVLPVNVVSEIIAVPPAYNHQLMHCCW
jgi:hypothetical protein